MPRTQALDAIVIKGAREHNLKNVDLTLLRNQLIIFTGLSGSGKSSLAINTLYAEGQRRYVESLSAYARQFLGQMEKPDVDDISGLSPAISIDQKSTSRNPRSTVGTVTEIYDYLRLLFARIGVPHCTNCGLEVTAQSAEQIVDRILEYPTGTRLQVLAPLVRGRKGEYHKLFEEIAKEGYARVRVDGEIRELQTFVGDGRVELDKKRKHTIEVIVDRLVMKDDLRKRLTDSVETTLRRGDGLLTLLAERPAVAGGAKPAGEEVSFSEKMACVECGISLDALEPRLFSFNSPYGACPTCSGLGAKIEIDPDKVIPDRSKSIDEGAIVPWSKPIGSGRFPSMNPYYRQQVERLLKKRKVKLSTPIENLPEDLLKIILYGSEEREAFSYESRSGHEWKYETTFEGVINNLQRRYNDTSSEYVKEDIERYMSAKTCTSCKGARLKPSALAVTIQGLNIDALTRLSIEAGLTFFSQWQPNTREAKIAQQILKEIHARLGFLVNVGLGYLSLSRTATTLSGGEAQRIRLATQIGSALVGVLYILDEPSIGLHQRDNDRLIATLQTLRDLGNTLIVIEHDEDTIRASDTVVDIGPGAGAEGGEIVAVGTVAEIEQHPTSLTGAYLSGRRVIALPTTRRKARSWVEIRNARANNIKGLDVRFPVGVFCAVTGVSGSGKSTLVHQILVRALSQRLRLGGKDSLERSEPESAFGGPMNSASFGRVSGTDALDKLVVIDQSPIGRTPRSNPATYTGVFDIIRELYAQLPEAKVRGYAVGRFSFNVKGGRCEACQGDGILKIEMHFLPDVYVQCDVCKGKRYNSQTLEVRYKGHSIADVLEMRVDEAREVFATIPRLLTRLTTLCDVGLGYVKMGQAATQLSGGEAQRVKLATELAKRATGKTFYVLDEPTTGLHFADIHKLLEVLQRLVDMGNSILVIEHNLDVIKQADWLIDMGPEGGDRGGSIVVAGTPEEVAKHRSSQTGKYLARVLADPRHKRHLSPDPDEIAALEAQNRDGLARLVEGERIPAPV